MIASTKATFLIRSGGHDFNKNHSTVENGVLIDLVNLNNITLSADKKSVTVGVGARWGAVYQALNGTGVSVNGARSPDPAIGGQTLSGGSGWFNNMAGPTVASVTGATVVLANSSIVSVDETNAPDLLWALRGGGANYGIVLSFTYKTLPIDRVWYGLRFYNASQNHELLKALVKYRELAIDEPKASLVFGLSLDTTSPQSFVGFVYADAVESPSVYSPFNLLPTALDAIPGTIGTLADLTALTGTPQYPQPGTVPQRHYVVTMPHKVDTATYYKSYAAFKSLSEPAVARGWAFIYRSQPISTAAAQAASDTPLRLEVVEQDWAYATLTWESPSDDSAATTLMANMGEGFATAAANHGSEIKFRFINDADDGQDALRSYREDNFERLVAIS